MPDAETHRRDSTLIQMQHALTPGVPGETQKFTLAKSSPSSCQCAHPAAQAALLSVQGLGTTTPMGRKMGRSRITLHHQLMFSPDCCTCLVGVG